MKMGVTYTPRGLVLSLAGNSLLGITNHEYSEEIPEEGVPVFGDLADMNPLSFRLYKGEHGYYVE